MKIGSFFRPDLWNTYLNINKDNLLKDYLPTKFETCVLELSAAQGIPTDRPIDIKVLP